MMWKLSIIGGAAAATSLRRDSHGMKIDSDAQMADPNNPLGEMFDQVVHTFINTGSKTNPCDDSDCAPGWTCDAGACVFEHMINKI